MWSRFVRFQNCAVALVALSCVGRAGAQLTDASPRKASSDLAAMDLEQLMRLEVVVAASKRAQSSRDVPSFVTVVTAAEIKDHGYETLSDVLKAIPSFDVTNDRNYSYDGVRGFDRPCD
jgi:outer membrane receptor for ferrienterochelin and colicin